MRSTGGTAPSMDHNLYSDKMSDESNLIKVTSSADVQATATAIANCFYENEEVVLRALGAQAVNQGVKSIAIARGYIAVRGMDLVCRPGFITVRGSNDEPLSAIVFRLNVA